MTVIELINKLRLYDRDQQVLIEVEGRSYPIYTIADVHNVPTIEANSWKEVDHGDTFRPKQSTRA